MRYFFPGGTTTGTFFVDSWIPNIGGKTDGLADAIAATKYTENIIDFSKILISGENPQRKTEEF